MADSNTPNSSIVTISQLGDDVSIGGRSDWGNKLVVNTGTNPVVNFSFMLRVEGVFDLPCKSVKGIHRENEFDYIQEGGLNDYVHLKRKAITKPFTFQVERYVGVNWVDPLPLGTELVLPVILFVNKDCFPDFKPVRNYVFTGCTVISKDYGELNAEVSGLLIETVTIAYREMVCLDIPMDAFETDNVWKFDGKKREGSGPRNYNSNLFNKDWETKYNSKGQMEERAKQFTHTQEAKKYVAAKYNKDEASKATMEGNAKRWDPTPGNDGKVEPLFGKDYKAYVKDYNEEIDKKIQDAATEEEKNGLKAQKIASGATSGAQYVHSEEAKKYVRAKYNQNEVSKAAMEQNAKGWEPASGEDGKTKGLYGKDYEEYVTNHNKMIDDQISAATTEEEKNSLKAQKIASGATSGAQYVHSKDAKKYVRAKYNQNEASKAVLEEKATKYSHSAEAKKYVAAKYDESEAGKSAMEAKATKYSHSATAKKYVAAKRGESEASKEALEEKASKYSHSATAKKYVAAKRNGKEASKEALEKKASKYNHSAEAKKYVAAKQDGKEASKEALEKKASKYSHSANAKNYVAAKRDGKEASKGALEKRASKYSHSTTAKNYVAAKYDNNEATKKALEAKASMYSHSAAPKKYVAAKYDSSEAGKATMENNARLWPKARSAKDITDFLKKS